MILHSCDPGHPTKAETGSKLSPSAGMGAERQGEWEHCCSFGATRSLFQSSSKGQFARGCAGWHAASKGAGGEESAEHSPASRVALCSPSFCIVTTMSNSPLDKLNIRKCQDFLPSPWFSVIWGMKMRKGQGQYLLLLK